MKIKSLPFQNLMVIVFLAILGAFLFIEPATAAGQGGGNGNNNQNGPNNNDSQPVLDLAKFTDVSALFAAVRKARADVAALPKSGADRPHIEKAIESLNAALSDSFTAENMDNLFQNVRQAVQSLEVVKGPKVAAQKIAGDLTEAIRAAVEKFLGNVERAIPRLTDTKTRARATKDLAKSKEDYGRGVTAISTSRIAAINHFQQAMKRMVGYPLVPAETIPARRFRWAYSGLISNPGNIFLDVIDPSGNQIEQIIVPEHPLVGISPDRQYAVVTSWVKDGDTTLSRMHNLRHVDRGLVRTFQAIPFSNITVTDSGAAIIWGIWAISHQNEFGNPSGYEVITHDGLGSDSVLLPSTVRLKFPSSAKGEFALVHSGLVVHYFSIKGNLLWARSLPAPVGPDSFFTSDGDLWISYWVGLGQPGRIYPRWWHWKSNVDAIEDLPWREGPVNQ